MSGDPRWMRAAIAIGRTGIGLTGANPSVGCVIVSDDGRVLGRARTAEGGRPHAERRALDEARRAFGQEAGGLLAGATAYVSLEPCSHYGRTPPCAEALIEARLRRVVVAIEDPDPRVSGRGLAMLRDAGVEVSLGLCAAEARDSLGGFLLNRMAGRPRVTLKLATSLDGRIATASGESRWISGAAARSYAHQLRAASDIVLVGSGTALADDPALDVRLAGMAATSPARAVADSTLQTPLEGKLVRSARERPLYLLHARDAPAERRAPLEEAGAELIALDRSDDGALSPSEMLAALGARGCLELLCEGGGRLAASLLAADLVDRLVWIGAGLAIGSDGAPSLGPLPGAALSDKPRFSQIESRRVGGDFVSIWRRAKTARA